MRLRGCQIPVWLFALVLLPSCNSKSNSTDPSVILLNEHSVDERVDNGIAYDAGVLDLEKAKKVVLPDTAVVRWSGEHGKILLFLEKRMGFGGHPPEPMSIQGARKNMGCAFRKEGDALIIATFGEFSTMEGGTDMKVVAILPDGVAMDQRKGLSGPKSAAQEWHGLYLSKPKDAKDGYWYGPASPSENWAAIPTVPDLKRTASK